jgi:aminoglycoside/choline kinase family phosphotransferase
MTETSILWSSPERHVAFVKWLDAIFLEQDLLRSSLRLASSDASFRRYFRIDSRQGSRIIMDAPPTLENCRPFVHVAGLLKDAGLFAPEVLNWSESLGFMLLTDLGTQTMMQEIDPIVPTANSGLYQRAIDTLIQWQLSSQPSVLPVYDERLLKSELELFPHWYLEQHRGVLIDEKLRQTLDQMFDVILAENLRWPSVFVHRDFMPRNLIVPESISENRMGVLDFQDAVFGPITYDIASLMRDAFLSWDEEFVLDITIRYWQQARLKGLPVGTDFGDFYRGVEWMGLQRHLKVAGIFARLGIRDNKPQYLSDTPRFIQYIRSCASRYSELRPLLHLIDVVEGIASPSGFAFGRV